MKGVNSLTAMRQRISQTSQEAGLSRCVWADHFAVVKILDHYRLKMLLINEASRCDQFSIVNPENDVKQETTDVDFDYRYFMIHRSRRQHYNLVFYELDGETALAFKSTNLLPKFVLSKWNIPPPAEIVEVTASDEDATEGATEGIVEGAASNQTNTKRQSETTKSETIKTVKKIKTKSSLKKMKL